jgi:hypothetical protein
MYLYLSHPGDDYHVGRFTTYTSCVNALVHSNPEMPPDAKVCIKVSDNTLEKVVKNGN